MTYFAFLVTSGLGATALVWDTWRNHPRRAALAAVGVAAAAVVYWVLAVPRFPGTGSALFDATLTLLVAILVPGGVGAAAAESRPTSVGLARGLMLMLILWLPFAFLGMFSTCQLDPRCDL